ncbi:hypothetical protein AX774_g3653 [Zancudomyces culisetae]|uniref:Uncharacterized protein n=1 Tax=Zancudomyces culisetae TaxID=1213189 RepID=A0A1R1PPG9_ZANCU|nr:hypothetical protein AX774_g3653 [Zancudomyces culisetae]|eukprot:OMH82858.1 hypothetical protein AX774_g3653 [Zancudomyces culisetae]
MKKYDKSAGMYVPLTFWDSVQALAPEHGLTVGLFVFLVCIVPIVFSFFLYQFKLWAVDGTTTNESYKWESVRNAIRDRVLFVVYPDSKNHNNTHNSERRRTNASDKEKEQADGHIEGAHTSIATSAASITTTTHPTDRFLYTRGYLEIIEPDEQENTHIPSDRVLVDSPDYIPNIYNFGLINNLRLMFYGHYTDSKITHKSK